MFPQLGGKSSSNANSVQAGYTVGYHKITSVFNANWNRSTSQSDELLYQCDRHCHRRSAFWGRAARRSTRAR